MWCRRRKEKEKIVKVINEALELIGKKRTLINNIPRRNFSWIGHIIRRNYHS